MDKIYKIIGELMITLGDMADKVNTANQWADAAEQSRRTLIDEIASKDQELKKAREHYLILEQDWTRLYNENASLKSKYGV